MAAVAERAPEASGKKVVAFVGEKSEDDVAAVLALLGLDSCRVDIREYAHTSGLLEGVQFLKSKRIALDLVVYITDHWMGQQNSSVLRERSNAKALMYLHRSGERLVLRIDRNIAYVQLTVHNKPLELSRIFRSAARVGEWPEQLAAV